jgi:lipase
VTLHLNAWGAEDAPALVCLHGVTAHGRRFRRLAEEHLTGFRVLAPDLRGHGFSTWEAPWSVEQHLEDVLATVGETPRLWLGHSFGGRLGVELAARRPELVERLVLLDPALQVLPHVALDLAELERQELVFPTHGEAVQARLDSGRIFHTPIEMLEEEMEQHLERHPVDRLLRFRYCKSAVITGWSIMATDPPFPRVPTLLVIGRQSWLLLDEQAEAYQAAIGDLLKVVHVPGGHTVLWDALDDTSRAISDFLA